MKKRFVEMISLIVLVTSQMAGVISVYAESKEEDKEIVSTESADIEKDIQVEDDQIKFSERSIEKGKEAEPISDNIVEHDDLINNSSKDSSMETKETIEKSDELHSGTFGTSDWRIDNDGILHIYEGEFATLINIFKSPWEEYSDKINAIKFEGPVKAHGNSYNLFGKLNLVSSFINLSYLDVSNTRIMTGMFSGMSSLSELDVTNFDTRNVTDMRNLFSGMSSLSEIDISNFDTRNVTDMGGMFSEMSSLRELDVIDMDTQNVTNMGGMFSGMSSLTELSVSNIDTQNVTNMSYMFSGMSSLTELDLTNFDTQNVTYMSYMFSGMSSLTELDVSNFDTRNVTDMSYMFSGMSYLYPGILSSLSELDVSNFDTSNVTNMSHMFSGISSLTELNLSNFITNNVTNMSYMFFEMDSLLDLDVSNFDTSSVTSMSYMFSGMSSLIELNLSNFTTSNVLSMSYMFLGMSSLNEIDITNFDTSNVTNLVAMFSGVNSLTTLDLSNFDTSNVINMNNMFNGMGSLISLDISNFDTNSIAGGTNYMFAGMNELRKIVLSPNFKFISGTGSFFPDAPSESPYTGKWMNIGDGTINSQSRKYVFTAEQLQTSYLGSDMADTYIWESDLSSINVHNSTIHVGDTWTAKDNFDNAIDKNGNEVPFSDIKVIGEVDTGESGEYEISYHYDGITSVAKVTVKEKETDPVINVHDSTIHVGDTWTAKDNFDNAIDKNGNEVLFSDIKVTGEVDTGKAGEYEISYHYDGESVILTV